MSAERRNGRRERNEKKATNAASTDEASLKNKPIRKFVGSAGCEFAVRRVAGCEFAVR